MPSRKFGKTVKPGKELARLFGKKLADATYRLKPSSGKQFGLPGILLKADSDYGRNYAEKVLCVCDRPLNFGRLAIYSDGNRKPKLVHFGCAMRAIQWVRLIDVYSGRNSNYSHVCFGPSWASEPKIAEPVDLSEVWASYNKHLAQGAEEPKTEAELTKQLDQIAIAVSETISETAAAAE